MFEQSILRPGAKTRRVWTVAAAFGVEMVGVGVAVLIPLVAFETIPGIVLAPPPLVAPPGPPPTPRHVEVVSVVRERRQARVFREPARIPGRIDMTVEPPRPEPVEPGPWVVGGMPKDVETSSGGSGRHQLMPNFDLPPAPVDVARVETVKRNDPVVPDKPVRVSEGVMQGRRIHKVVPVYPGHARSARIQGVVHLQAIIGRDGRVRELQVISGHPWLVSAAVDAVRQWLYQPTTLSGVPVEIITEVKVTFTLK